MTTDRSWLFSSRVWEALVTPPGDVNDRCDKCSTPKRLWNEIECVKSLTQSPRHTITRFYFPFPDAKGWADTRPITLHIDGCSLPGGHPGPCDV